MKNKWLDQAKKRAVVEQFKQHDATATKDLDARIDAWFVRYLTSRAVRLHRTP